ncbi:MAG: formylglycine-generating enzyme family protein [Acidobacteria bacterium]|nr:formylglycine-generating enzyme family protein [Acidobacteriota bacterium]
MSSKLIRIVMFFVTIGVIAAFAPGKLPENMVMVKGGSFLMGTNDLATEEEPIHDVSLDNFYIGKYEVTQKEWLEIMGKNPSTFIGDNLPVDNIDWYMAIDYCTKKSIKDGLTPCYTGSGDAIVCNFEVDGYRLPTEAEWEYAAVGGLKSHDYEYSGSNDPNEVAWHETNCEDKTQPVGLKKPNELGIYDMSGNIWEWCWDWYDPDYYKKSPEKNPRGAESGKIRGYRGGGGPGGRISWLRIRARYNLFPSYKSFDMGFRIVKNTSGKVPANMVLVPGGTFKMGCKDGGSGEKPAHKIIVNDFSIGKYPVTQKEWRQVMNNNPSDWVGEKSPVEAVTWYDAVEYCNKRSQIEGLTPCYSGNKPNIVCNFAADGYRLPTEAEWEYAARGGAESKNYKYSGSNNPDEVAWFNENSTFKTNPVGMKKPNELGIYDMSGNVLEWCWDWFDRNYYKISPTDNPTGPITDDVRRVLRGGWIAGTEVQISVTHRIAYKPSRLSYGIGFRVVRTMK